jgi:hypothetical protein
MTTPISRTRPAAESPAAPEPGPRPPGVARPVYCPRCRLVLIDATADYLVLGTGGRIYQPLTITCPCGKKWRWAPGRLKDA